MRKISAVSLAIAIAVIAGCAGEAESSQETSLLSTTTSTSRPDLKTKTMATAAALKEVLCPDGSELVGPCEVDGTRAGVVVVDLGGYPNERLLAKAVDETGLWGNADVVRMANAGPADGEQESSDGTVMWKYDGNSGLQLIIEVE